MVQHLLGALMSHTVRRGQDLGPQGRRGGNKDVAAMEDEAVDDGPIGRREALGDLILCRGDLRQAIGLAAKVVKEFERRRRHGACGHQLLVTP